YASSPDHNYKFKIRSHIGATPNNSEFFSAYSGESTTVYTTSSAPTIQAPIVNSSTAITWNWLDSSAFEEAFHLDFVTGSGTDIDDIAADETSYQTTNLIPNTAYSTHVHSYRTDTGESDASETSDEVYTLANTPSDLATTVNGQEQITTAWSNNSNPNGTEYYIENMNTGANSGWITDTAWVSNSLICGIEYSFRVKSRNASNLETAYSPIRSITTDSCSLGLPISSSNPPKTPEKTEDNPEGTFKISINDDNVYTNRSIVNLKLYAGKDTTRMAISNSEDFKDASIIDYEEEVRWDLGDYVILSETKNPVSPQDISGSFVKAQDDGMRTVYAKFYTKYGVASQTVSDSIKLDNTPPELSINETQDTYYTDEDITISGITEPNAKIIFNLDSKLFGIVYIEKNGSWNLELGRLTEGKHTIRLIAQDHIGNSSETSLVFFEVKQKIIIPEKEPIETEIPTGDISEEETIEDETPEQIETIPEEETPSEQEETPIENIPPEITEEIPETPAVMQGNWNLVTIKPFSTEFTPQDIAMIVEKFPELKETFQNLGITDFSNPENFQNASFSLPGFNEAIGLGSTAINSSYDNIQSIPLTQLSAELKKEVPSNIVFIKSINGNLDISSSLSFSGDTSGQKTALLPGKSFELILRPDNPAKNIKGYLTFKSQKTAQTSNGILNKISRLFSNEADAEEIEEKLVLSEFNFQDTDQDGIWTANLQTPQVTGEYELITLIEYEDLNLGSKTIRMITVIDPEGYVYESIKGQELHIKGATVSLYHLNPETQEYELWKAGEFQQQNPQITDERGTYSFLVPYGKYYLVVLADGYEDYQSEPFDITAGSGVHMNLELIPQSDWKDNLTWQNILLVVFGIALFYNFSRDRRLRRKLRKGSAEE
ncbi:MAG: carboxypeptidase regulatory-like domain-containing protein, partial [Candidatus Pacebacteria bacterium]|nr:carboxypeptidase regulatory-like domain-containing protein [Candidatus Paceibacterota bacterium]